MAARSAVTTGAVTTDIESGSLKTRETRKARTSLPLSYWLHSLLGLKVSVLLAFVSLTGTLATVAHDLEWLVMPEVRASPYTVGEEDWGAMWAAVQQAMPDSQVDSVGSYDRADASYFVKKASVTGPEGNTFNVYVDPGTNTVTGIEHSRSFQDIMRGLHYYLFTPGDAVFFLIASLGFVLFVTLVTGLIAYKKFWRGLFRMPRWAQPMRTWMGDIHRLGGLWSVWFVFIMSITSIWYFVERAGLDFNSQPPVLSLSPDNPQDSPQDKTEGKYVLTVQDINTWTELAKQTMPGLHITAVSLPTRKGQLAAVQGQWRAALVRERANVVYIDPSSAKVIGTRAAHEMSIGERITHTADPLHFGNFGGLTSKMIYVVFGLVMTLLSVSGAVIYTKRTKAVLRDGLTTDAFNYLGAWKWPSLVAVTLVPLIAYVFW
ncbi:MAG: PepSY-associated TM helix domain-containing protein [Rhodospirillaceae bacterium]